MPINTALLTPQFFMDRMKKPTQLDFSFPCPFLWDHILEQKQIAEQRDHKSKLLQEIKETSKTEFNAHKLGAVPLMNRLEAMLNGDDKHIELTPQFTSLNNELRDIYGVMWGCGVYSEQYQETPYQETLWDEVKKTTEYREFKKNGREFVLYIQENSWWRWWAAKEGVDF